MQYRESPTIPEKRSNTEQSSDKVISDSLKSLSLPEPQVRRIRAKKFHPINQHQSMIKSTMITQNVSRSLPTFVPHLKNTLMIGKISC